MLSCFVKNMSTRTSQPKAQSTEGLDIVWCGESKQGQRRVEKRWSSQQDACKLRGSHAQPRHSREGAWSDGVTASIRGSSLSPKLMYPVEPKLGTNHWRCASTNWRKSKIIRSGWQRPEEGSGQNLPDTDRFPICTSSFCLGNNPRMVDQAHSLQEWPYEFTILCHIPEEQYFTAPTPIFLRQSLLVYYFSVVMIK